MFLKVTLSSGSHSEEPPGILVASQRGQIVSAQGIHCTTVLIVNSVVWTKNNPTPWNTVKQDENTKLMAVNQKFGKRCVHGIPSFHFDLSLMSGRSPQLDERQVVRDRTRTLIGHLIHMSACTSILYHAIPIPNSSLLLSALCDTPGIGWYTTASESGVHGPGALHFFSFATAAWANTFYTSPTSPPLAPVLSTW